MKDPTLFNLLVGKSEDGKDLCDLVYEYPRKLGVEGLSTKVLPSKLADIDISLDDLVDDNKKARILFEMLRAVDVSKQYGAKVVKKWKPPILQVRVKDETL